MLIEKVDPIFKRLERYSGRILAQLDISLGDSLTLTN